MSKGVADKERKEMKPRDNKCAEQKQFKSEGAVMRNKTKPFPK